MSGVVSIGRHVPQISQKASDLLSCWIRRGFSETKLKRVAQFGQEYPRLFAIGARPVPQLLEGGGFKKEDKQLQVAARHESSGGNRISRPDQALGVYAKLGWAHKVMLIQKVKRQPARGTATGRADRRARQGMGAMWV